MSVPFSCLMDFGQPPALTVAASGTDASTVGCDFVQLLETPCEERKVCGRRSNSVREYRRL